MSVAIYCEKRDHYQQRGPNNSGIASHDEGKDLCVARRGMMKMSANRGFTSFSSQFAQFARQVMMREGDLCVAKELPQTLPSFLPSTVKHRWWWWHIYDLCACSFDLEREMSTQMISFVANCTDLSITRPLKVGSIGIEALCLSISLPTASIIIRWTLTS